MTRKRDAERAHERARDLDALRDAVDNAAAEITEAGRAEITE